MYRKITQLGIAFFFLAQKDMFEKNVSNTYADSKMVKGQERKK